MFSGKNKENQNRYPGMYPPTPGYPPPTSMYPPTPGYPPTSSIYPPTPGYPPPTQPPGPIIGEGSYNINARLERLEREIIEINRRLNNLSRRTRRVENYLNIRDEE